MDIEIDSLYGIWLIPPVYPQKMVKFAQPQPQPHRSALCTPKVVKRWIWLNKGINT